MITFFLIMCETTKTLPMFGLSLSTQANIDQVVAGVLALVVFYLVATAVSRQEACTAVAAVPVAMLTVGLIIGTSIVKAAGVKA